MSNSTFDFTACFNLAWETYKKNLLLLVGASLVASLLISFSFGILTGPILAGLMILMLKLIANDPDAKFEDIFSQFSTFKTTFLLCLAWGAAAYIAMIILMIIPLFGQVASIVVALGLCVFLTFAVLLAAEKGMDFGPASRTAFEMLKKDLWPLLGYAAVASILSSLGAIACGIGAIFTMPLLYLMLATAYRSCATGTPIDDMIPLDPVKPAAAEPVEEAPAEPETPVAEPETPVAEPDEKPTKEPAEEPTQKPDEEPPEPTQTNKPKPE